MTNEKGGLIKKKKKPIMQPPAPVKKTQATDFSYSTVSVEKEEQQPIGQQPVTKQPFKEQADRKKAQTIGQQNSTKSLKVPSEIHTQINLLGSFMDESKTYLILQRLIDSYVKNELTNRQQRQFEFMLEASLKEISQK